MHDMTLLLSEVNYDSMMKKKPKRFPAEESKNRSVTSINSVKNYITVESSHQNFKSINTVIYLFVQSNNNISWTE